MVGLSEDKVNSGAGGLCMHRVLLGPLPGVMAVIAALIAALAFAPTASAATSPWPMFQHDLRHSGRSALLGPTSAHVRWSRGLAGEPGSPAIASNGTIYVPAGMLGEDSRGFLYAINPNGTLKWRASLPGPPSSTAPAIGPDGTVYVHANGPQNTVSNETLTALNPPTAPVGGALASVLPSRLPSSPLRLSFPRPAGSGLAR